MVKFVNEELGYAARRLADEVIGELALNDLRFVVAAHDP